MAHIRGNKDGPNGSNVTYKVGKRPNVPRVQVVKEVKQGMHPDVHVFKLYGQEYPRDNPDASKRDNVNR